MQLLLLQIIGSFIATIGFGILTNVPKNALIYCGLTGMFGWVIFWISKNHFFNITTATFLAALFVSVFSSFLSRRLKLPVTVFNIPGIFPLVPGITAFQMIKSLLAGNYETGVTLLIQTITLSFSIALALIVAELFNKVVTGRRKQKNS